MIDKTLNVFKEVFSGCTDHFLEVFSREIIPKAEVFYSFHEEEIAAEGFTFPIFTEIDGKTYKGLYLYGLCTLPNYRRQGRMGNILSEIDLFATQNGFDFAFLATDNCEAIKLYRKNGYNELDISSKYHDFSSKSFVFEYVSTEEYIENTFPDIYPEKEMRLSVLKASNEFLAPVKTKDGYFIYDVEDNTIYDYFPASYAKMLTEDGKAVNPKLLEDKYRYFLKKFTKMPDIKVINYIFD